MKKLGILTIGQSPRPDILGELLPLFDNDIEIFEAGALDGLTMEEIRVRMEGLSGKPVILSKTLATEKVVEILRTI